MPAHLLRVGVPARGVGTPTGVGMPTDGVGTPRQPTAREERGTRDTCGRVRRVRGGVAPGAKPAYVVSLGADTVTPISTATNRPGRPIKVGVHPYAIAITS